MASPMVAQHMVGKEYVRPIDAFLTKDWATVRARHPTVITEADVYYGSRVL